MAEYLIQGETLTNIADKVRTLSGTTETMSLGTIITSVDDANTEIENQESLLDQITNALANKVGHNTIYIGTTVPTSDIGIGGDIYIIRGETT